MKIEKNRFCIDFIHVIAVCKIVCTSVHFEIVVKFVLRISRFWTIRPFTAPMSSQPSRSTQRGRQLRPPTRRDFDDAQSPPQRHSRPRKRARETLDISSPTRNPSDEDTPPPPSKKQQQALERLRLQEGRLQREEFVVTATTLLGIHRVYNVSKSVKLGAFNFIQFYSNALVKVRSFAENINAEYDGPFECTAMATFNNNKEEDVTNDVNEEEDWKSIESIIRNWMKQGKAGIRVKLIQKYKMKGGELQLPTTPAPPAVITSRSSTSRVDKPVRRACTFLTLLMCLDANRYSS